MNAQDLLALAQGLLDFENPRFASAMGNLLDSVPKDDKGRLTEIYNKALVLQDEGGMNTVAAELGDLWKGLKAVLPDTELDTCFAQLLAVVIEGDMLTPLRQAHKEIKANHAAADKSKALLIEAAVTSGLPEDHYFGNWVDGDALSADIKDYWEWNYNVDILDWVEHGHGGITRGAGSDPVAAARQQLKKGLVDAVPVSDFDDVLANIMTKLRGGEIKNNRDMLRRYRKGQRA